VSFGDATPSSPQAIILAWERGELGEREGCPDLSDEARIKEEKDKFGILSWALLSRADGFWSPFMIQEGRTGKDG
jgi:hypothetical protein